MHQSATFLCVDDEPSVLLMEKMLLETAGFHVLTASSGREAINLFKSESVDVVVMDYFMPGMDGIDTARIMKQLRPTIPILFLSAYSELPGETLGIAEQWIKKGQHDPEMFLSLLRAVADKSRLAKA